MGEVRALRLILIAIMLVHGLIHLMGLAKAFGYADLKDLKQPIAKPVGLLWLLCAAAFVASAALWLVHQEFWW
ncbi:MAG: hypothetical protein MUF51_11395, partial [Vicinamibacteria bacterium]|nr:hypothetical protein [Vicinamibacteria bacterium]